MKHVEPKVFLIAKTGLDYNKIREWLDFIGAVDYDIPTMCNQDSGALLVQLIAKRCYMSYQVGLNPNITKIRKDLGEFIENILKVGHGSVLEHVSYSFAIENVSRVFTAEMNRHRAGMAISEGSMRYIKLEDISFWIPDSIHDDENDNEHIKAAKKATRALFDFAFLGMGETYRELSRIWDYDEGVKEFSQKKQLTSLFRRIIGTGVATGGVWTGNLRALRHIFTTRCAVSAEEEMIKVASLMLDEMIKAEPLLFKDFHKDDLGYWTPKYIKV